MLTQEEFRKALERAITQVGSQTALAEKLGMTQSQISDYLRGRFLIENITIGNLYKLFPCAKIDLSPEKYLAEPVAKSLEEQLFELYRSLSPEQQVKCYGIVVANFPEKLREEAKR